MNQDISENENNDVSNNEYKTLDIRNPIEIEKRMQEIERRSRKGKVR